MTPSITIADVSVNEGAGTATLTVTRANPGSSTSTYNYSTSTVTNGATANVDFTSTSGSGSFSNSETTDTFTVPIIDDASVETPEAFLVNLSAGTNVTVSDSTATVTITDNDVLPPEEPPEPDPVPVPDPSDPGGTSDDIASNFDINLTIRNASIPGSNDPDVVGAFRFICAAGQLRYDDPIVYPGQPGKSHLHQFYGNTSIDANSTTYASVREHGGSTCNIVNGASETGIAANRSAYWIPAMLDGKGKVVQPDFVQLYYKRLPKNDITCTLDGKNVCVTIPNNLRFIQGYDMVNHLRPTSQIMHFKCAGAGATTVVTVDIPSQVGRCPVGSQLAASISSGGCWDGKNLDTPDHRSHLSEMIRNASTNWITRCPSTHPHPLPKLTLTIFYTIQTGDDLNLWKLSSDDHARMFDPTIKNGESGHMDYIEGWDPNVKAMWTDGCIDLKLNCSAGNTGSGKTLIGADIGTVKTYSALTPRRVAIPANE